MERAALSEPQPGATSMVATPEQAGAAPPALDLHAELLMHLHGFSHGIAELGNGWDLLARRVCVNCIPCVGRGRPCDRDDVPAALPMLPVPSAPLVAVV